MMQNLGGASLRNSMMLMTKKKCVYYINIRKDIEIKKTSCYNLEKKWYNKIPFIRGFFFDGKQKECVDSFLSDFSHEVKLLLREKCDNNNLGKKINMELKNESKSKSKSKNTHFTRKILLFLILLLLSMGNITKFIVVYNFFLLLYLSLQIIIAVPVRKTHGAEHMVINCYLNKQKVNINNIKKSSRFNLECGGCFSALQILFLISVNFTLPHVIKSFLYFFIISFIIFLFNKGIIFEIFLIAKKCKYNPFIWPGLLMQIVTTGQPNERQIDVAIKTFELLNLNNS